MAIAQTAIRPVALSTFWEAWKRPLLFALILMVAYGVLWDLSMAADDDAFTEAATTFNDWITGNLGKLAALVALSVGAVVAAVRKDWSWFFGAIILSMGIGIMVGVINSSFTAVV